MTEQREVRLDDGRTLRVHDSGADPEARLTVVWHHGSPQTGALLEPVLRAAVARRIRLLSYGRPSYGGSTPRPGRDVASAADDVAAIADAAGIERFAAMGASGGGPHALACAGLLGSRIVGAVTLAGIAPYRERDGTPAAFDFFGGMVAPGGLRAASEGREARTRFAETDEFDASSFIAADYAELDGTWRSLGADAGAAGAAGDDGLIDDDVAFASPWGFDLASVESPVLVVQGGRDRVVPAAHGTYLLDALPTAELWLRPRDGHVSVLTAVPVALDWLLGLPGG